VAAADCGDGVRGLNMVQIFASGFYGFDLDRWAAFSFSRESTRDRLLRTMRPGDYALHFIPGNATKADIGIRGRLMALLRLDLRAVRTADWVDPEWESRADIDRWPYALPILEVLTFESPPRIRDIIPRFYEKGLMRSASTFFVQLTSEEVDRVLSLKTDSEKQGLYRPG
jgi:hypothetical protein